MFKKLLLLSSNHKTSTCKMEVEKKKKEKQTEDNEPFMSPSFTSFLVNDEERDDEGAAQEMMRMPKYFLSCSRKIKVSTV